MITLRDRRLDHVQEPTAHGVLFQVVRSFPKGATDMVIAVTPLMMAQLKEEGMKRPRFAGYDVVVDESLPTFGPNGKEPEEEMEPEPAA